MLFQAPLLFAQPDNRSRNVDVAIVESELDYSGATRIGADQFADPLSGPPEASPKKPPEPEVQVNIPGELQSSQIIQTHQILRRTIEDNAELRLKALEAEDDMRIIRGQRQIESNRLNALIIERDAYKQKSEEALQIKNQILDDWDRLQLEQRTKAKQLEDKILGMENEIFNQPRVKELENQISKFDQALKKAIREKEELLKKPGHEHLHEQVKTLKASLAEKERQLHDQDRLEKQVHDLTASLEKERSRQDRDSGRKKIRELNDEIQELKKDLQMTRQLQKAAGSDHAKTIIERDEAIAGLKDQKKRLERELEKLRENRLADLTESRDASQTAAARYHDETARYQAGASLQKQQKAVNRQTGDDSSPDEYQPRRRAREEGLPQDDVSSSLEQVLDVQEESLRVMALVDDLRHQNMRINRDEARIHYNMGNIYFRKGDYKRAKQEYLKAVELSPDDADAHFNIAFVASDYLHDPRTAIEHYQRYLEINPDAEDVPLVEEKILEAELYLRSELNSSLERDLRNYYIEHNQI